MISLKLFDIQKSVIILTLLKMLPYHVQNQESISTVTYKLGSTIRNNIANYKVVVNSMTKLIRR